MTDAVSPSVASGMDLDDDADLDLGDDEISVQSFEDQPWQHEDVLQSRPGWQIVPPADLFQGAENGLEDDPSVPTGSDYSHLYRLTPILRVGQAFDNTGPWFRFLAIAPGAWLDPISCKLFSRPLFDAPPYDALSYSWGSGPANREITIDKIVFFVSHHLWKALRRLRKTTRTVNIWVDAICIDQQSAVERAAQVHIMAQIYNQAVNVRIWLGDEDKFPIYSLTDASLFWLLSLDPTPWWKRLWVVQECAYSRDCPLVMLGHTEVTLQELVDRWRIAMHSCDSVEQHRQYWLLEGNFPFLEGLCKAWQTNDHRRPLAERLEENSRRQCSNSRDRVYALLSLTNEAEASQMAPDYRISLRDLQLRLHQVISRYPIPEWADILSMEQERTHSKIERPSPLETSAYGDLLCLAIAARCEDVVVLVLEHSIVLSVDDESFFSALLSTIYQTLPDMLDMLLGHSGCLRAIDRIPDVYDRDDPETTLDPREYDRKNPHAHSRRAPFLRLLTFADSIKDSVMLRRLLSNGNFIRKITMPSRCRAIVQHAIRNNRKILLLQVLEQPQLRAAVRRSVAVPDLLLEACRDQRRNEVVAVLAKNHKDIGVIPAVYAEALEIALENRNEDCVVTLVNAANSSQLRTIQFPRSITNMAAVRILDAFVKTGTQFSLRTSHVREIISNAIAKGYVDVAAAAFCAGDIGIRRALVTQVTASVFRVTDPRPLVAALREMGEDIDGHELLYDALTPVAYPKHSPLISKRRRALVSGLRLRQSDRLSREQEKPGAQRQGRLDQWSCVDMSHKVPHEPTILSDLQCNRVAPRGFGRSRSWHQRLT